MQKKWNEIWEEFSSANKELNSFLQNGGLSNSHLQKIKPYLKTWNKLKQLIQDFDGFITPVEPLNIGLPWETENFKEIWCYWKEYLKEQHNVFMRTRAEKMALKYLEEISSSSETKAIKIIEFSCYVRSKSFVIPPEKIENNKNVIDDGTFG